MSKTATVKYEPRPGRALTTRGNPNSVNGLSWKLASGESLAEHALRFGFLAPALLGFAAQTGGRGWGHGRLGRAR